MDFYWNYLEPHSAMLIFYSFTDSSLKRCEPCFKNYFYKMLIITGCNSTVASVFGKWVRRTYWKTICPNPPFSVGTEQSSSFLCWERTEINLLEFCCIFEPSQYDPAGIFLSLPKLDEMSSLKKNIKHSTWKNLTDSVWVNGHFLPFTNQCLIVK